MAKTILEQLMALMTPEEQASIKAKIAANPQIAADDAYTTNLFGIFKGIDEGTPAATEPPAAAAAVHVPTVPSAAAPPAAAAVSTPVAVAGDNAAILAALSKLSTSIDDRFKNVVTADQLPKLGAELVNNAIAHSLRQSDELATIRETFRDEFPGEKFDKAAFEKFVLDAQDPVSKRSKYNTLTDAFDAMVAQKRMDAKIATGIADGVKQKTSSATVPGQTQSTSLSPAQQVIQKAKSASAGGAKTNLQLAIEKAAALETGGATVQ